MIASVKQKIRRALFSVFALLSLPGYADVLTAWDLAGVDAADLPAGAPYEFAATTRHVSGSVDGALMLGGGVNPSTTAGQYGFKVSSADEQITLAGAIAENHYIQFTLIADEGFCFNLSSLEMKGESSSTGSDNVALMSDVDGFVSGNEIATLGERQGVTGGWDTDASGWGSPIDLSDSQYQKRTAITFRIYGWNTTSGSGVTALRNLSGDDLIISGTLEAIPEPAVITFISIAGLGTIFVRRLLGRE